VVVDVYAELHETETDNVNASEERIVSQWQNLSLSADDSHRMRNQVDEILRPIGAQTRLLVIERAN